MPVERTTSQTVNLVMKTIRAEIEKAAQDTVLSTSEQNKLRPGVKGHIADFRKPGKAVTVTGAVNYIKPIVNRAMQAIAGTDGKIDAGEVQNLRVTELRTRAASLFDEGGTSGTTRTQLDAAIKATAIGPITRYGKEFFITEFTAGNTPRSIVAAIADTSEEDLGSLSDWGKTTVGVSAVTRFNATLRAAVRGNAIDPEDPADAVKIRNAYKGMETAAKAFFNADDFKKISLIQHQIQEDGDVERNILMGQRNNGAWVTLTYLDFPF